MKIEDVDKPFEQKFDFDVVEDAIIFMRNDPTFYRKSYFPTMCKMAEMNIAGKDIDAIKVLSPMVEKGVNQYCKTYNLGKTSDDVFTQPDRDALIDKIFSEEMEQINKGEYK